MGKTFSISHVQLVTAATLVLLSCAVTGFAQTDSRSGSDRATEEQNILKGKITELQAKLSKFESAQPRHAASPDPTAAKGGMGCCPSSASGNGKSLEGLAQASPASEPSPAAGSEHPMGSGMGGMEGEMGGGGTMGGASASPAASPGGMPMEEHMKGMEHMHGMMHGNENGASPAASPGGMEHGMEHPMGGMGGSGMGGGGMQGRTGGAQPEASPSGGMGGGMKDDM